MPQREADKKSRPAFTRLPPAENYAVNNLARASGRTRSAQLRTMIQENLRARHDRDRIAGTTNAPAA
jgi:hypothetical protein